MNYVLQQSKSFICSAIIKYGLNNFSLEILEYCEPSKLLIREKYYIDLGAEYNIFKDPTIPPMSGRTHSDKTKRILSEVNKGKTFDEKTKSKISDALVGNTNKKGKPRAKGAGVPSQQIEVTDSTNNTITSYDSIGEAAKALNINRSNIAMYFLRNQQNPYKGRYTFKKVKF